MYVLKVIRIFLSLLEVYISKYSEKSKSQEQTHERAWMDFRLCVELWKIFTCREEIPIRTYPNYFSQFDFTKVKKSFNQLL